MDKLLFTPGPLTTSRMVKEAMLRDLGSRDTEFIGIVRDVRARLLALGGVSASSGYGYEAVLMQGAGTFGLESVVGSTIPNDGELLVIVNGAYGARIAHIARTLGIKTHVLELSETERPSPKSVELELARHPDVSHVALVHCETTTGILNPVEEIGAVVRRAGKRFIVDSMSAFGATPVHLREAGIDFLVSSANKCIEGVPGFSFVLCERGALLECEGRARSVSLDLVAQWRGLERDGQFRFTPPTHAMLAFQRALDELDAEGGVAARGERYRDNQRELVRGMHELGFRELLPADVQGSVITTFHFLDHPSFDFAQFYRRLSDLGFVIYPGKVSRFPCFRVGTCGSIDVDDVRDLLDAMRTTLSELQIESAPSAQ